MLYLRNASVLTLSLAVFLSTYFDAHLEVSHETHTLFCDSLLQTVLPIRWKYSYHGQVIMPVLVPSRGVTNWGGKKQCENFPGWMYLAGTKSPRSFLVLTCWRYSQIPERSWERLEADPTPSCLCEHKRQGRGLPPYRKNGFLNPTSCGTVLHIHRGAAGRSAAHMNWTGLFSENKPTTPDHFLPLTASISDLLAEEKSVNSVPDYCGLMVIYFERTGIQNSCKQAGRKKKRRGRELSIWRLFVSVLELILFL